MRDEDRRWYEKQGYVFVKYSPDYSQVIFHLKFGDPVVMLVPEGVVPEPLPITYVMKMIEVRRDYGGGTSQDDMDLWRRVHRRMA